YMDPNVTYFITGYRNVRMWTRQLFTFPAEQGKAMTVVPDLATETPTADNGGISADGKTVTVGMRTDAQWNTSPPRQVTAQDLVRGVKRTCNPVQPFGGTPNFADLIVGYHEFCDGFSKVSSNAKAIADYINTTDLSGVVAKDDHTVVFKLTQPASYIVGMLTMPAFSPAPKEVLKYLPASRELAQNQISDGPYQVETWNPTKEVVYTRNPAWKASSDPVRKAYVDKIVVTEGLTEQSIQQQLETGTPRADLGWDTGPPSARVPALIAKKDPNLILGETADSNPYILFNTASPNNDGALKNVKVRQALEYAINRDHLIQVLGGPKINPPLTHVLPPNIDGSQDFDLYMYDVEKAKQLLQQAGVSNLRLKLLYRSAEENNAKVFATVQQDLKAAGIAVEGVVSPNADFYTKYLFVPSAARRGVWDLALAGWGAEWYGNGALTYFKPLFAGKPSFPPTGSNYGLYDSAKANALIQQAVTAKTEGQAAALWGKADKQVMEDAAFFPITNPQWPTYHASQVHNAVYVPSIQGFDPT
ncbi:MAG: ABC transporter substrate-binding protein, partial [Microlunatus sp.]|nr:ABC transporter substrate-binding protein [Microlunatus sp.]